MFYLIPGFFDRVGLRKKLRNLYQFIPNRLRTRTIQPNNKVHRGTLFVWCLFLLWWWYLQKDPCLANKNPQQGVTTRILEFPTILILSGFSWFCLKILNRHQYAIWISQFYIPKRLDSLEFETEQLHLRNSVVTALGSLNPIWPAFYW